MPHLWTPDNQNQSIDKIKHKLVVNKYDWKSARRMEDSTTRIRKYEETIQCLMQQLRTVCEERDEARHQLQVLLTKLQPCASKKPSSMTMSTEQCSDLSYKSSASSFSTYHYCHLSLASDRTKGSADYVAPPRGINDMVDRLVCGRPLPQKGRLLRTVTEAGPLLHTLLLAPLPQWRNPPLEDDDYNDKLVDDVIPTTSLSLAFHGNSRMSSPPTLDVVHPNDDRGFTGKKRFL